MTPDERKKRIEEIRRSVALVDADMLKWFPDERDLKLLLSEIDRQGGALNKLETQLAEAKEVLNIIAIENREDRVEEIKAEACDLLEKWRK